MAWTIAPANTTKIGKATSRSVSSTPRTVRTISLRCLAWRKIFAIA